MVRVCRRQTKVFCLQLGKGKASQRWLRTSQWWLSTSLWWLSTSQWWLSTRPLPANLYRLPQSPPTAWKGVNIQKKNYVGPAMGSQMNGFWGPGWAWKNWSSNARSLWGANGCTARAKDGCCSWRSSNGGWWRRRVFRSGSQIGTANSQRWLQDKKQRLLTKWEAPKELQLVVGKQEISQVLLLKRSSQRWLLKIPKAKKARDG